MSLGATALLIFLSLAVAVIWLGLFSGTLFEGFITGIRIPFSTIAETGGSAVGARKPFGVSATVLASTADTVCPTTVGRTCAEQPRATAASNRTLDFIVLNTST